MVGGMKMDFSGFGIIAVGLGVAAIMAAIQYAIGRQRPKELAGDHGTLHLNDSMIAVGILIVWGLGCAAVFYHLAIESSFPAIVLAFISLVAVPVMATAFSSAYDISWSTQGITGPTTRRHPPFAPERQEIAFDDIVAAGRDKWGNYYVQDEGGNRIRWNWFYNGYPELMHFVEDVCPHLFPDLEEEEPSTA